MIKINNKLPIDIKDHLRKNGNMWQEYISDGVYNEYLSFPRVIYKVQGEEMFQLEIEEIPKFILRDLIR